MASSNEEEAGEFQDWEVLHKSDDTGLVNSSYSVENLKGLEEIGSDSEGMIRSDYFSLDSHRKYVRSVPEADVSEGGSVESDNPSWIDPGTETRYPRKESAEFWSDSGSDRSEDRKFGEFDAKNELGFVENEKVQVGLKEIGEIETHSENSGKYWSDSGGIIPIEMRFEDLEKDSEMGIGYYANSQEGPELAGEEKGDGGDDNSVGNKDVAIVPVKSSGTEEKRSVVWWKLPLEFLKYCVFRVSPVWTFSVAAAVMGFVILGRRLYKMKQKSRSLQLKVTVDDKKVSQFMSRAARLNEAFSVVKRVPIIRPSLPAAGVTPWPSVMSLR
ncbi:uncharacterized protein LOC132273920 [Cornus florida]|uniref:uncharacterized protein LOC132273920 n=1 Tax=Cornus florida TaxID=4283 RepID=UPI00289B44AE|nr:uncharacterized protein LOC132273920 [Cornus florida]